MLNGKESNFNIDGIKDISLGYQSVGTCYLLKAIETDRLSVGGTRLSAGWLAAPVMDV